MSEVELNKHSRNWIGFLVERPIAVMTGLLTIGVLGLIAYSRIPVQLLPSGWGSQSLSIYVPFPNSSPYETLEKVTRLVEEEIKTIPGVMEVHSSSSADYASIDIEFSGTANMDLAYAEVRDRMERVRPRLPNGADRYFIWRFSLDESAPVMFGGLLFDADSSEDKIQVLAEDIIQKRIESVDGVARMNVHGLLDQSVRILLDEDRCRAARINLYELVNQLGKDNFAMPLGKIEEGGARYLLRVNTKYESLDEIRNLPIGNGLKISDVGEVKTVQSVREDLARINGKFSLFTSISKNSGANAVDLCKRINAAFTELEGRQDLSGFKFLKFFDQGEMIQGSLRHVGDSAMWGGVFAVLVLFIFLHQARLTLLVALAIPISALMTLIYQYFTGETFNMISMMGMTIGIGMLVDNAIVVVENIYRLKEKGIAMREAAIRGAQEVGLAITLSTLTAIVVFLPLMFMSEDKNLRIAFKAIGVPLSISHLASLFVALIFIPAAIYHLMRNKTSPLEKLWVRVPSVLPAFYRVLHSIMGWTLRHRMATLTLLVILVSTPLWPMFHLAKSAGGGDMGLHFHVTLELPRNLKLSEASEEIQIYEDFVASKKKEYRYDDVSAEFDRVRGEMTLWYSEPIPLEEFRAITKKVREELPQRPGMKVGLRTHIAGEGGGEERGGLQLVLSGKDPQLLANLGEEVKRRLETIPEFTSVRSALENGREEVRVKINREKTNSLSLSPEMVSEVIEWGLRGYNLPRYQVDDREMPLIVQFARGADESLNNLRDLKIMTAGGQRDIPLAAIADFSVSKSYGQIYRRDGKTILNINADTQEKDLTLLWPKIRAALETMEFPSGYGWHEDGGLQEWNDNALQMTMVFLLGLILVYIIMGILFESAMLPISVTITIPTALMGAYWLLFFTKTPLDMVGMIGFIVLAGIVVNNGILLVDRINRLRKFEGMERAAAIVQASHDRLRPILMTALTTIAGLLPMAFAEANPQEGISYNTLAVVVIGGLAVSTVLTLWTVPLLYTLVEDLSINIRRAMRVRGTS